VTALYVAHARISSPGSYYVLARPIGKVRIAGIHGLLVRSESAAPSIGTRAYPSRTPTLARRPRCARAVRRHVREPRYCESRTCGPVVDAVDRARTRFARTGTRIRFIHVEIYQDNDPSKGPNPWVRQWHLPGEPWTFLVGADRRIKAKFDGSFSSRELNDAIRRLLL
jgi:hypothetical protein